MLISLPDQSLRERSEGPAGVGGDGLSLTSPTSSSWAAVLCEDHLDA